MTKLRNAFLILLAAFISVIGRGLAPAVGAVLAHHTAHAAEPPAVTPSASASTAEVTPAELATVRARIAWVNRDWIEALKAKQAHRAVLPYAQDGINVGVDGHVQSGFAAIEQAMTDRLANGPYLIDGTLEDDGILPDGALVVEMGHARLHWKKANGEDLFTSGRFLTVWRHDADGEWRIIRNLVL
jgi:uncharacterized protein (TIGR02246 family)